MMHDFCEPIQLLVTDVVMPDIGGRQLAEALRADIPSLPVIYISGYHTDTSIQASSLKLNESLLMKPFTTQQLVTAVRKLIDELATSTL